MANKRAKLSDIAREAGVSLTAASFYINGKAKQYKLSPATCERLEAAVRKYDYVPNLFARAMQQNRTFLIGLLVRDRINSSFWSDIIAGIENGIAASGCHLVLAGSHVDAAGELDAIRQMRAKGVDGYVVSPVIGGDGGFPNLSELQELAAFRPVVGLNAELPGIPSVYNDDVIGGRLVAECFRRHGHRRVALLGSGGYFALPRFRAFEAFFAERGLRRAVVHPGRSAGAVQRIFSGLLRQRLSGRRTLQQCRLRRNPHPGPFLRDRLRRTRLAEAPLAAPGDRRSAQGRTRRSDCGPAPAGV